jgi:hypothetical protein
LKLDELVTVPAGVVTAIGPVFAPVGTVATILVSEMTLNCPLEPPNFTVVAPVKFAPVIVTRVPAGPLTGEKPLIVGSATTVKAEALVAVPPGVATVIGPLVAPTGTEVVI